MKRFILFVPVLFILASVHAQSGEGKTLEECLKYAVEHQTNLRQSVIDQQITERQIKYQLAEWYPQIGFSGTLQHNFQKQTSIFNNTANPVGTSNVSGGYFGLNQTIFNRNVVIAQQSARDVRLSAKQNTINTQIEVVANVSKAFYDLLLSHEQISLLDTDIVLLDEPCSNLDANGIRLYHSLIEDHCSRRLVVVCSNDEVEYKFCKEVINITNYKPVSK